MKTKVGAKFFSGSWRPAKPAAIDDREQRDAERAARDLDAAAPSARPSRRGAGASRRARAAGCGHRTRERDERDDEHDRGRPGEQPLGDRQVRALDEAVGQPPLSTRPAQRRIAKKTWTPLLQRKVIVEPLKFRQ